MSAQPGTAPSGIIKLAVMAVGGQGGGVLTAWIEAMARANGYTCQATSVAGVAQRTGATIYYVEMAPKGPRTPIYALAPAAGDVDILIAAEMMEAGRAILRGFVTPDRTTLIASTHRALAVSEKTVPGDGIANADEVRAAADIAARRTLFLDMEALAVAQGSAISSALFGALAASGALPFPCDAFEAAIRAGGKGVETSLRAFKAAHEAALAGEDRTAIERPPAATPVPVGPTHLMQSWARLVDRAARLPPQARDMARAGLQKVVDFQDISYGANYLDRVEAFAALDHTLTTEAAKHIANAMAYDDVIRIADLKTRAPRFARIRDEMGATDAHLVHLTEYFHPRAEEIAGLLPARIGARVLASPAWMRRIGWLAKGRHLRSDGILSFTALWCVAALRPLRGRTLRHAQEVAHLDRWLATAHAHLPANPDLAVEIIRCRRLIKGYSDTHARGLSKFDRVLEGSALVAHRPDAPDWTRRLREAALKDEEGRALDGALATIRSFT